MSRPAALVLTPRLPWPVDDGGRVVSWQNLLAIADHYETTLLSFAPEGDRTPIPTDLKSRDVRVVTVPFAPPPGWLAAIRGLVGRWPYQLSRYRSRAFERAVRAEIARKRPAFVLVQSLHLATYVDAFDGVPMILREQNVEFLWMSRYARAQGPGARGLYAFLQAMRLRRAEAELCGRAAMVLAIQEEEARVLRAIAPRAHVETLPVGVDLAAIPPRSPEARPLVLLAASFQWPPNVDGATRFLREGWPRLRERAPGAVLRLAGKSPPAALGDLCAEAGAELAADVPSMATEYARATLLLVPLWVGAGARVKIVEALAARLPVVATSVAVAGLDLKADRHYVAGETPEALADAAASLLGRPERLAELAAAGHAFAASRWSLEAVAGRQMRLIASVVGDHGAGQGARPAAQT